jgi:hypothetical protein
VVWRQPPKIYLVYQTCIAYEQIGEDHPQILKYLGPDEWTGFPILARPSGPPLKKFLLEHSAAMFPPELEDSSIKLSPKYHPLVLSWSLQLLSTLSFIHPHSIIYSAQDLMSVCFLSSTLSLLLVGFLDARFVDEYGYKSVISYNNASVKQDLRTWQLSFIFV